MKRDAYSKDAELGRLLSREDHVNGPLAGRAIKRLVRTCRAMGRAVAAYGKLIDEKHKELAAALAFPGVPGAGAWPVLIEAVRAREIRIRNLELALAQAQRALLQQAAGTLPAHDCEDPDCPAKRRAAPAQEGGSNGQG